MKKLFALALIAFPLSAFAGGSVSFTDEVMPILRERPELSEPVLHGLQVSEIGEARRIGSRVSPALGGARLPPYVFQARKGGKDLLLVVNTDVDFFNSEGHVVARLVDGEPADEGAGLADAVEMKERLSSVVLKALD